jgi:predicted ATPase
MKADLTRFRIEGLHGRKRFIDLRLENNRAILIGENGTGKSTIVNLIYYLLTRQWRRLKDYQFVSLEATVSGQSVRLTHDEVDLLAARQSAHVHGRASSHFWGRYSARTVSELYDSMSQRALFDPAFSDADIDVIIEETGATPALARRMAVELKTAARKKLPKNLSQILEFLNTVHFGQFLYLPTYRRIEQDLKSIFRGIEIEEKVREFRERFKKREQTSFIELVEFGMGDVDKTIQERMARIKESVRTGLSNLTGTYLREVLRGVQEPADVEILRNIDPAAFQSILARIDEAILPVSDKKLLQEKIAEIAAGYTFRQEDKVIAHFLSKLVALFREQQEAETDVRDFVGLCNAYLTGKSFVYDDIRYSISVRQDEPLSPPVDDADRQQLELRMLSSGEKQIVSLFSHIYLSGVRDFFVIIDEPELSLSVPWQQRFLPDLINTDRCTGLVAVTHSPFIWENTLEKYVRGPADFVENANVLR